MSLTLHTVNTITFDLDIYTYQIDFSGFVSNITYIQWLEVAWLKLLEAVALPRNELGSYGLVPVLTQTSIQYWRPLELGDHVRVELWITRIEEARLDLQIRFHNTDECTVAEASQNWIFTAGDTRLPKALSAELRSVFEPYLQIEESSQ